MISRAAKKYKYITLIDLLNNTSTIYTAGTQVRASIPGLGYEKFKVLTKNSNIAFYNGYIIAVSHEPPRKQNRKGCINNMAYMKRLKKLEKEQTLNTPK